jgi:hypothetical protein
LPFQEILGFERHTKPVVMNEMFGMGEMNGMFGMGGIFGMGEMFGMGGKFRYFAEVNEKS